MYDTQGPQVPELKHYFATYFWFAEHHLNAIMKAHKCNEKELLFLKLGRYCTLHFTKCQYLVYEETEMEGLFSESLHAADSPMH